MRERTGILIGLVTGAALGAVAGYLFLTEEGRRFRERIEPELEHLVDEMGRLRETATRASAAAAEGWRAVGEAARTRPAARW